MDSERSAAVRDVWRAFWSSRLLVWVVGILSVRTIGVLSATEALNPRGLTSGLGKVGEALAGPAARWDAGWYLTIAKYGYQPSLGHATLARSAFFPLYPLLIGAVNLIGIPVVAGGIIVSLCACAAALYGLHRLSTLEFAHIGRNAAGEPRDLARLTVLLMAFAPMAVFLSAIYTEALFLACSVAMFLCARRGRWAWAGLLGALAVATRTTGLVLALPALVLYLYGPREDRVADHPLRRPGAGASAAARLRAALRPRFSLRPDVLWLALLPLAVLVVLGSLALAGGAFTAPLNAEHEVWRRELVGPVTTVWRAIHHPHVSILFLIGAVPATIGIFRRLPVAYGLYTLTAILVACSDPVRTEDPVTSLPRYMLVLFPICMWLSLWLADHPRLRRPALILSGLAMAYFTMRFSTWRWAS